MRTKYIIMGVMGLAAIASAAVGYGASKAYDKSYIWGVDQARKGRSEETVKVFTERDEAKAAAQVIFDRENKEVTKEESHLKAQYDAQVRKTDRIMQSERFQVDRHVADMRSRHSDADLRCREIVAQEESRLDELLKHDGEYKAYKETRKTRRNAGKSVDKVEAKMERRKSELKDSIVNGRSDAEKKAFEERDYYAYEMANSREYADSLIRQRSDADKAEFEELKRIDAELNKRKERRARVEGKRTLEEQSKVDRYRALQAKAKSIETAEAKNVDRLQAFAGYLVDDGWKPAEVAVLGSIPLLTATGLFAWVAAKYIGKLRALTKAMKACPVA